jgi:hypothetical protein
LSKSYCANIFPENYGLNAIPESTSYNLSNINGQILGLDGSKSHRSLIFVYVHRLVFAVCKLRPKLIHQIDPQMERRQSLKISFSQPNFMKKSVSMGLNFPGFSQVSDERVLTSFRGCPGLGWGASQGSFHCRLFSHPSTAEPQRLPKVYPTGRNITVHKGTFNQAFFIYVGPPVSILVDTSFLKLAAAIFS